MGEAQTSKEEIEACASGDEGNQILKTFENDYTQGSSKTVSGSFQSPLVTWSDVMLTLNACSLTKLRLVRLFYRGRELWDLEAI